MKKILFSCIIIAGTQLFIFSLFAQGPSIADGPPREMRYLDENIGRNTGSINQKSIERFHQQFGNENKERWEATKSGSRVSFMDDGVRSSVSYNRHGRWLNTIVNRNEHHVTKQTAELIRASYPEYRIILEITVDSYKGSATLVKIENEINCKTLRLVDGQMELVSEFERAR